MEGVSATALARLLGVTEPAITYHRYGQCKHLSERPVSIHAVTIEWSREKLKNDIRWLERYQAQTTRTGAEKVHAFRVRKRLQQAAKEGIVVP